MARAPDVYIYKTRLNAGECGDDLGDLGGRAVLALPPERVADAVDEMVIALGVTRQQVAGGKVLVALLKRVAHELLLRGLGVRIAGELRRWVVGFDGHQQLARLARGALDAATVGPAHELLLLHVEPSQLVPRRPLQQPAQAPHGSARVGGFAVVEQRAVAFRCAVEFANLGNVETRLELLPNLGAQAVANGNAHLVRAVKLARRGAHQVAAQLANVPVRAHGALC